MEEIRLPDGQLADVDQDCIVVQRLKDSRHSLTGAALSGEQSVAFGSAIYDTFDEAVSAGLAWAEGHGVERLYVCSVGPDDSLSPV